MPSEFEIDTAVEGGNGHYQATVTDRWSIGGRPNGGYLQSIVVGAIGLEVPQPDLLTSTAHFLAPVEPGPATIDVEVLKRGRSLANARGQLIQDGQVKLSVLASHGSLAAEGRTAVFESPPVLEDLIDVDHRPFEINQRFEYRTDVVTARTLGGEPPTDARPEMAGRIRFRDGYVPTTSALPLVVDAFPPTMFMLGLFGWTPTLELTVHGRGVPSSDWLTARLRGRYLIDGLFAEDCELWDDTDRLVAQSRQLARVMV